MTTHLEFIQGLSPLFSHNKRIKSPLGAAAYYTLLIETFPTTFTQLSLDARTAMGTNINKNKLSTGRQDLLELGFIAEVLPVFQNNGTDFNREMYLPISPELIWNDNKENLKEIISEDGIKQRYDLIRELQNIYIMNFGRYGTKIKDKSITVFHSSQWMLYYLIYNLQDNKTLRLLLGTLRSFNDLYIRHYEHMQQQGLKTKIVCDPITKDSAIIIKNILHLKNKYPDFLQMRITPLTYGTSRRMIYDNMAIDGKKLLDFGNDLSYISTIYFQDDVIKRLGNNFDKAFEISFEISQEIT